MPKSRVYVRWKGKTIDGVSYHPNDGYYIRVPDRSTGRSIKRAFGRGEAALWRAKAEYDLISQPYRLVPAISLEEAVEQIESCGGSVNDEDRDELAQRWIDATDKTEKAKVLLDVDVSRDDLAQNLSDIPPFTPQRVEPPLADRIKEQEILAELKGLRLKTKPPILETRNPNGQVITVAEIGDIYRSWYLQAHNINQGQLEERARIQQEEYVKNHKEFIDALHEVQEGKRQRVRAKLTKRNMRRKTPKKFDWMQFLPKREAQAIRENTKYYGEFVTFIRVRHGSDIPIAQLSGDDFREYYNHVHAQANANKKLTNRDRWRNNRFEAVTRSFRRLRKQYPDCQYPQGLWGVDGLLSILEQKNTVSEGKKTPLEPHEFKLLLSVSDPQWFALLHIAMNAALENESISKIPWTAIRWQQGLMIFPRPKTGRIRQTPLAQQTLDALKNWQKESGRNEGSIFYTDHGKPWISTTDNLGKHWDLLRTKVEELYQHKIEATFKSLRKMASTTAMIATKNELAVDMLLGHAPAKSWRHYVLSAPEFLHEAVKAIADKYF